MRAASTILLLACLAACRSESSAEGQGASDQPRTEAAAKQPGVLIFAGAGRDRLCLDERAGRAGLIVYGDGNQNCTVQGTLEQGAIKPNGDTSCRIQLSRSPDAVTLRQGGEACDYYCAPGVSFAEKRFTPSREPLAVTDLAGDPLC